MTIADNVFRCFESQPTTSPPKNNTNVDKLLRDERCIETYNLPPKSQHACLRTSQRYSWRQLFFTQPSHNPPPGRLRRPSNTRRPDQDSHRNVTKRHHSSRGSLPRAHRRRDLRKCHGRAGLAHHLWWKGCAARIPALASTLDRDMLCEGSERCWRWIFCVPEGIVSLC